MHQVINFKRPFRGEPDEEAKVRHAAARIVQSASEMGIRAMDVSSGTNLKIIHEGMLDYGRFLEMSCGHIREILENRYCKQ